MLQEAALERMAKADKLSPMEVGDAEDEIGDWLDDHDVAEQLGPGAGAGGGGGEAGLAGRGRRHGAARS